jgi:hypothetical protein
MTDKTDHTSEVIPAAVGEAAPTPKLKEDEQLKLSAMWSKMQAIKAAQVAYINEQKKLEAEAKVAALLAAEQTRVGVELEQKLQQQLNNLKNKYNIPENWTINTETGIISPPQNS